MTAFASHGQPPFARRATHSCATARWCAAGSMPCCSSCLRSCVVGGATRLTNSGLSITEWKPIHGVIPPLNEAEWQEEFAKYQQIPQYEQINQGMTLDGFKRIFWWEWAHRVLARGVGFVFALPLVFFSGHGPHRARAWCPSWSASWRSAALQGAIGWWMVASGLVEPHRCQPVSPRDPSDARGA